MLTYEDEYEEAGHKIEQGKVKTQELIKLELPTPQKVNIKYMPISVINQMKDPECEKLKRAINRLQHRRPHSQTPRKVTSDDSEQCLLAFSACGFAKMKRLAFEEKDHRNANLVGAKKKNFLPPMSRHSVLNRNSILSNKILNVAVNNNMGAPNSPKRISRMGNILYSNLLGGSENRNSTKTDRNQTDSNSPNQRKLGSQNGFLSPGHGSLLNSSPNHGSPNHGSIKEVPGATMLYRKNSNQNLLEMETSCWDGVILYENYSEQAETILKHLEDQNKIKRNRDMEKKIFNRWIRALPREDRELEYFAELEREVGCFTRYLPINELQKDIEKVFGVGEKRRLRPGEEAAIIEAIIRLLRECSNQPELMLHSVSALVNTILKRSKLENLNKYPFCFKQTECHWKIMATRFRCNGSPQYLTKRFEKVFTSSIAKTHFYNLYHEENTIVKYLLKYSDRLGENMNEPDYIFPN